MLLPPEPSAIASEFPILINDAMAWNHDRNSIPAIRGTNGTLRVFGADGAGEVFIRTGFSIWNAQQLIPHTLLKRSAGKNQWHGKTLQPGREILFKFILER